jgi:hypothetical protein
VDGGRGAWRTYAIYDLAPLGAELPAGGYIVLGNQAVLDRLPAGTPHLLVPLDGMQNGPRDGMVLVHGHGPMPPVLDRMSYKGVLAEVTEGNLDAGSADGDPSLSRCPEALDTNDNGADFRQTPPTPGAPNHCPDLLLCPFDDAHEENDTLATAAPITLNGPQVVGVACANDLDYYTFDARQGCTLHATLGFHQADGNLDLRLVDRDGNEVASSLSATDDEALDYVATYSGAYALRVNVLDLQGAYALQVSQACP